MATWSEAYVEEWRRSKENVFTALALMIDQYVFVPQTRSWDEYTQLLQDVLLDWTTILKYISAKRINTSLREKVSDEVEAMLVSVHCLAVIAWDKMHNKFDPDSEWDVCHDFMGAGERAVAELERYGLMTSVVGGGIWTRTGIDMLNGKLR